MYVLISVVKLLLSSFILFLQTSSMFSSEASSTYTGIPSCISMISGVLPHISKHLYWVMLKERKIIRKKLICFSLLLSLKHIIHSYKKFIYYYHCAVTLTTIRTMAVLEYNSSTIFWQTEIDCGNASSDK